MAFAKTLQDQKLVIFCDYCFRNITKQTYFRCEDCKFDSCASCAFHQIETNIHRKFHRFRVVSNLDKSFNSSGWRLIDELLLIDGIISFGFDNFEDIAKLLKPKTEIEIKDHLYDIIGIIDDKSNESSNMVVQKSNPNDSCVASYMSKRKEFDSEILNEYESLIEDLVFEENDTELETEFKRFLLENYRTVLKRRKIWRSFILDRNLMNIMNLKSKETTEIGEAISKKKWIAQYFSKTDFNIFIAGLAIENNLKSQILKHPGMQEIQEDKLQDNSGLLSNKESKFCTDLNIPIAVYSKLKKLAFEMYILKLPLKNTFFELFSSEDSLRAKIIYKWFLDQNIVIE